MPFQVTAYLQLIAALRELGRSPRPVADFLRSSMSRDVFIRHDVDRRPAMAVQLAEREASVGVSASYYFRCDSTGRFPEDACRRIARLGHETGYHYEDFSRCGGDRAKAIEAFCRNLAALRKLAPCITVSMHGSPLSTYDNRQLLDAGIIAEQGLLGDVSTGLAGRKFLYFTDAGGSWNDARLNRRDRMGTMPEGVNPLDRAALEQVERAHADQPLGFNLHPERWTANSWQFLTSAALDFAAAAAKVFLRVTQR